MARVGDPRLVRRPGRTSGLPMTAGLALALMVLASCSPAVWQGVAAGMAASSPTKLMIFGGRGHDTYLGCLNCSEHDSDSVFNEYGSHGSSYGPQSIQNPYGRFGSQYSSYSACNRYASEPPVIVDEAGDFYGRLTLNRYHPQAMSDGEWRAWLAAVCEG